MLIAAVAVVGCGESPNARTLKVREVGAIAAQLTLPDNSEIDSVHYEISGPGGYSIEGDVPVDNSTILTFRKGNIPVGPGYTITLSALTGFGNTCEGMTMFDVLDNQTTRVFVSMLCGATDNEGDIIVEGEILSCPIITAVTVIPGEVTLGNTVAVSATISHGTNPVEWSGPGGTFADADAYSTEFTCETEGSHVLTVAVNTADCNDAQTFEVTCSLGAGCGNGQLDTGEQCDGTPDCNPANCRFYTCGDGIDNPVGTEECDDGNAVNDDDCSNACTENECGNDRVDPGEACDGTPDCNPETCRLLGCGDGIPTSPEECDDGNVVDDDECSNACTENECGNGRVDPGEACDGSPDCTPECTFVDFGGDIANASADCRTCRAANCTNYQGLDINLVAGCFENPDPGFVQACVDMLNCAYEENCGYNAFGAPQCYCGTTEIPCTGAVAPNGPCIDEFEAATGATAPADVMERSGDFSFPSGWAFYMQECATMFCAACRP